MKLPATCPPQRLMLSIIVIVICYRLGAKEPVCLGWRGSFAFAGYAGEDKPLWITQKGEKNGLGPSEISLKIPLSTPSD